MRYTLFACDEVGGHQMRSSSDLEPLKRAADNLTTKAVEDGNDLQYVVKVAYRVVYRGRKAREHGTNFVRA